MRSAVRCAAVAALSALVAGAFTLAPQPPAAQAATPTVIHVSPTGRDGAAGTAAAPLRTITEAWNRIPRGTPLAAGVTIALAPGAYPAAVMPHYWEDRHGTANAPIIITSSGAPRSALLRGDLNLFNIEHLRVDGVRIERPGDIIHCELCRNVTVANSVLDGQGAAHETYKANQSSDLTVVNSLLRGSYENALDFVAVQRATIERNIFDDADDWCAYVKGGSTDIVVRHNEFRNCGTGGFTAGQGTGLEFMVAPWLTYEATNITVASNYFHDIWGAAFGVNGGRNVVIENNVAARVGTRSHLLEVSFGERSCDGDAAQCQRFLDAGAWGTAVAGGSVSAVIPDRDVTIRGNTIVNPAGVVSQWQHLEISTPRTNSGRAIGPSPARTDDGLRITGNTIRNGGASMPLGIDDSAVCRPANPTCTVAQILRDNDINGARAVPVPTAVPGGIVPGPGGTPVTPPAPRAPTTAPGIPRATAGAAAMVVYWATPAVGATRHIAAATPARGGPTVTCVATTEKFCIMRGLANSTAYRVTVTGVNDVGPGPSAQVPGLVVPRPRCVVQSPTPPNAALAAAINARIASDPIFREEFGAIVTSLMPCNPSVAAAVTSAVAAAIRAEPNGAVARAIREAMAEAAAQDAEIRADPTGPTARRVAAERSIA